MRKQEREAGAPRDEDRLHLKMRPPSPATYRAPRISRGNWILIVAGAVSVLTFLFAFLSLLMYALVAGDP